MAHERMLGREAPTSKADPYLVRRAGMAWYRGRYLESFVRRRFS